jgi:hypothetical protein
MNTDLDALATALYVTIDDLLIAHPEWRPERPAVGIAIRKRLSGERFVLRTMARRRRGGSGRRRCGPGVHRGGRSRA